MKRFLLPVLFLFSLTAHAQWSAGIRSGIGVWGTNAFNENTFQYEEVKKNIWQHQVYTRYEINKTFAFEAGLGVMSTEAPGEVFGICGTGMPAEFSFVRGNRYRESVYTLDLRAMLRPSFMHWGRLSNELGLVVAPGISHSETIENVVHYSVDGITEHEQSTFDNRTCIQIGCEDQLRYVIGKHVEALAAGGFRVQNGARFFNNGMYAQIGLGYRF